MTSPGGNASLLSDRQVDIIATRLAERLSASDVAKPPVSAGDREPQLVPHLAPREALGEGIFATVDDAVEAAGIAFRQLDELSLEQRKLIIASIRESMLEHAEQLACHAQRETGLGRAEHKFIKNKLVV